MSEMWLDIKNFEGYYQVSSTGRVKRVKRKYTQPSGKISVTKDGFLTPNPMANGYSYVILSREGAVKNCLIHRLVAEAFIPNPENKPVVSHINGDTFDNSVTNLVWRTQQEVVDQCRLEGKFKSATNAKSQPTIDHIKSLWSRGYNKREIAQLVGVSPQTVHKYILEGISV